MNEIRDVHLYLEDLIHGIPSEIYVGAAILLCIGLLFLLKWKGYKKGIRYIALLAFAEYVTLIYCSTVVFRTTREVHKYDFHPFWSYNDSSLFVENIMNVIVFIPIGILLGLWFKKGKLWKTIGMGCLISISIEVLQLFFKRGFSEVDDVIHNTLGCAIGFGIAQLIMIVYSAIVKQNKGVKYC